ncbi:MAG: hypothetical protein RI571_11895 [Roseovarius sp.]|nr:hypothetical protein [Roseovarius sp.]
MSAWHAFRAATLVVALLLPGVGTAGPELCVPHPYTAPPGASAARIARTVEAITPVLVEFASMRDAVDEEKPEICLSDALRDAHGYLDPAANRIVLGATLGAEMRSAVLLHEIRHLSQIRRRACPGATASMRANAIGVMAMEADASAITALAAWYLKERGDPGVWNALSVWPTQADITVAFAAEMQRSAQISRAVEAAFAQWYASDQRRDLYYVAACTDYLDEKDRTKARFQYEPLPEDFLQRLCRLPGGHGYACAPPAGPVR